MEVFYTYYLAIARWLIALLSIGLAVGWVRYFKALKRPLPILAELTTADGLSIPITSKENVIGRGKRADILIPLKSIHTKHALLYVKNDRWYLSPAEGKISINLQNLSQPAPLDYGDKISIAKQQLTFRNRSGEEISSKKSPGAAVYILILTVIQLLVLCQIMLRFKSELHGMVPVCFALLIGGEWIYYLIGRLFKNFTMITELPVLFLTTFGLAVCSCVYPEQLLKQTLCYLVGLALAFALCFLLRHPDFIQKLQRVIMILSLALLYYTAFFGTITGGARNWLTIGGFSFQPSELCKPAFVLCGGATLYTIIKKPKIQWEFLVYSFLSMGALAIMYDFGAVLIFFVGMLMILTLRLMHPAIIFGLSGGAAVGGVCLLLFYPYIARRFGVWLHAWEYADSTGYQQTRTMIAAASGGMLGVGGGNGRLSAVSAADSDLVFGIISEEWGGIVALVIAFSLAALVFYAYRLAKNAGSSFYTVTVLGAAVMLIFQSALNIFGSLDLLPLTGVTLIFVSRGGTSIIGALLMLAFFKGAELNKKQISPWRYEE